MILQVGELLEQKQQHQPTRMATLQHLKMNARKRRFLCEPSFFSFHLYKSGWPNFTPSPLNWGSFIETAKQEHKHFSDDSQTSTKGFTSYEKLMSPWYKHHPKKVEPHQTLPCKPPWGLIVSKSSFYETSWWFSPPIWKGNMLLKSDHLQFVGAKICLKNIWNHHLGRFLFHTTYGFHGEFPGFPEGVFFSASESVFSRRPSTSGKLGQKAICFLYLGRQQMWEQNQWRMEGRFLGLLRCGCGCGCGCGCVCVCVCGCGCGCGCCCCCCCCGCCCCCCCNCCCFCRVVGIRLTGILTIVYEMIPNIIG